MDAIQAEYGWLDEYVFDLRLSRLAQIRDAIFIRTQAEMFNRHYEIEWMAKHLALIMVNTTPGGDKDWRANISNTIISWDMDSVATGGDVDAVDETLDSEEAIEAMWARGASAALERNLSGPSFGSVKLS